MINFLLRPKIDNSILISSMGRSGSTWIGQIINHRNNYREIFEPFLYSRVPDAEVFRYCQYLPENEVSTIHFKAAKKILLGEFRNKWTDKGNNILFTRRNLIKDIRTNLMLGWLKKSFPELCIVLLIRNPIFVISSWKKLNWGIEPDGEIRDLDHIICQKKLLLDFPIIENAIKTFDHSDYITSLALLWAILYYVPLNQESSKNFHILYYEDLLIKSPECVSKLLVDLGVKINFSNLRKSIEKPSKTAYSKNKFKETNHELTIHEVEIIQKVLEYFNLGEYLTRGLVK